LNSFTVLDGSFDNSNLTGLIDVCGGKGKKKRKAFTTPKKTKHKHKNTKLLALSYYAL
jgi:small subunit ribosomal protein S27Ae